MTPPLPLLLLPGLLCDAALWEAQAAALAGAAAPVVADLTRDDSLAAMAGRALALLPPAGPVAVAGLSMGGYVALEIARRIPDRLSHLALLDTSARADSSEQGRRRRGLLAAVAAAPGRFRGVAPRLLPQLVHPDHVHGPVGRAVTAMAARVGRDAYLRQQAAILARPDSRPGLPVIRAATLVAVGEADALTPPALSAEMAAAIPGAVLRIVPGCGHLPPMEAPDATTALLRAWLATAAPGGEPAGFR